MKNPIVHKILALIAAVLVLFPIILMLITGIVGSIIERQLLIDYLLPLELVLCPLIGFILLIIPTWKNKRNLLKTIIFFSVMMLAFLSITIGASLSGIANGDTPITPLIETLIGIGIGIFVIGECGLGVMSIIIYLQISPTKQKD